ncbi:hypothetical protein WG926_03510 [Tistrella sp. BH-R2-4]|uniref:Uncharacterized protein n=1 Tax=Tistrella arctica TaxID=3133430 RepID=A0ABU9YEZ2_9PROT
MAGAVEQRRVVQIGNPRLDGVIETLEAQFRFGGSPPQFGDMLAKALGLIFAAAEDAAKQLHQPVGIEQAFGGNIAR